MLSGDFLYGISGFSDSVHPPEYKQKSHHGEREQPQMKKYVFPVFPVSAGIPGETDRQEKGGGKKQYRQEKIFL